MSEHNYSDDAETNDGRVIVWGLQDLKESLDSLVEQQRIANLLTVALGQHADTGMSRVASDLAYMTLVDGGQDGMLNPEIAAALGIGDGDE